MVMRFGGGKDSERRLAAQRGDLSFHVGMGTVLTAREYRKRSTIYAVQMPEAFEVVTLEGLHTGKALDWLAIGVQGEMYPIDADVFRASYEAVEE